MKTYSYQELKDSKIMYDKNPPKLMSWVILIIVALLSVIVFLSIKTNKTFIVKGQGMVSSDNKQYIMSAVNGEIISTDIKEGQQIKQGDVIAVIKSPDINLQKQQLEEQIKVFDERIALLERLESDLINYKNTFNKNDSVESEFYYRIQSMYISQSEYKVNVDSLKKQGYTDAQIQDYEKNSNTKRQQIRSQYMNDTYKEKVQYNSEKQKLEIQLAAVKNGEDEYMITASSSGTVHLTTPLSNGMVVQAGSSLGTISDNTDLYIETYISSADRARIENNDKVSIAVNGLIQSDYGVISGTVTEIDSDATINQENGNIIFKAKVLPDQMYLSGKNGDKVNLVSGMTSEVRIKYDKVSYFKYVLDGLGIKNI